MNSFTSSFRSLLDFLFNSSVCDSRSKLIFVGLIFLMPMMVGCQEDEDPLEPGSEVSLNRIRENPDFAALPLIGTQWKLIGFADQKTGNIRLAMPVSSNSYALTFERDGTLTGRTSTNSAFGRYALTNNMVSISNFSNMTEINELYDGLLYIETMNKVNSFNFSSKGLSLNYDDGKFLLFKPLE